MTSPRGKSAPHVGGPSGPPLKQALDQSEKVKEKVEDAAADLSDVNDTLKEDERGGVPLMKVKQALAKSEGIETELREAAEELVAVNEELTKEIAERDALEHADRHAWRIAVMFLDLNGFKQVNDTYGHDFGDRVLQEVAVRLSETVRAVDSVARRGGDEFLVLALEVQDDESVYALGTKLCEQIRAPMEMDGVNITVSTSVGVCVYPDDATTAAALLKCADLAMYVAKREKLCVARHAWPIET